MAACSRCGCFEPFQNMTEECCFAQGLGGCLFEQEVAKISPCTPPNAEVPVKQEAEVKEEEEEDDNIPEDDMSPEVKQPHHPPPRHTLWSQDALGQPPPQQPPPEPATLWWPDAEDDNIPPWHRAKDD